MQMLLHPEKCKMMNHFNTMTTTNHIPCNRMKRRIWESSQTTNSPSQNIYVNKIRTYNPVFSLLSGDVVLHDTQTLSAGVRGVGSDARTSVGDDDTGEIETFACEGNEGCDEARGGSGRARRRGRSHDERRVGSVGGDRSLVSPLFSY